MPREPKHEYLNSRDNLKIRKPDLQINFVSRSSQVLHHLTVDTTGSQPRLSRSGSMGIGDGLWKIRFLGHG